MTKRLTEDMVVARTKISDLAKIKRLNCWGSEIGDVTLLRRMPNVEVLSLSINKINSLADIQFCKRLEELYIRQNEIADLNQVVYLQNLPNLRNLWLGENPCAEVVGYRLAVLKALPQLQKLDNIQVTQEELREAQKKGCPLNHPEEERPEDSEEGEEDRSHHHPAYNAAYQDYNTESSEYSPPVQRAPTRQEPDLEATENGDSYEKEACSEDNTEPSPPSSQSLSRGESTSNRYNNDIYADQRRNSYEKEQPARHSNQYYDRSTGSDSCEESPPCEGVCNEKRIVNSKSANCIKEYSNGDRFVQTHQSYPNDVGSVHSGDRGRDRFVCPAAMHKPPFNRRPVTRNSNILSAVLCLVKELDYPSLEVVEMAVRCRMDEIDD